MLSQKFRRAPFLFFPFFRPEAKILEPLNNLPCRSLGVGIVVGTPVVAEKNLCVNEPEGGKTYW